MEDNQVNIKDIVSARFQNPKFVFDGKRVQPIYERRSYDFSSAYIYQKFLEPTEPVLNRNLDLSSQIISLKDPFLCTPLECVTSKFVHLSINKIRSPVNVVLWNNDGRRLLSGSSSGEITMWNGSCFNFDTILQAHESPIRAMTWSPSSTFLISGDNAGLIKFWHPSMNNIQVIEAHQEGVKDLSFCYSDAKFCSASDDSKIKIWDSVSSKSERVLSGHNWDVRKAQWHPTKALIASGGKDNLLKLWDPRQEECITTFHHHKNTILSLMFYKENYVLSGGKDQLIKMLDLRTMKEVFQYKNKCKDVTALAKHPFSDMFCSGSNEGRIQFWNCFESEPIGVSDEKHDNTVWSLDFNPSGHILTSGGADYMIKFWVRPRPEDYEEITVEEDVKSDENMIPGLLE